MTTQLSVVRTASALAITAVLLNLVCAAMVALWPAEAISLANSWMHGLDLEPIRATAPMSLGGFIAGSVALAAVSFVAGSVFAWVYNSLHKFGRAETTARQHAAR